MASVTVLSHVIIKYFLSNLVYFIVILSVIIKNQVINIEFFFFFFVHKWIVVTVQFPELIFHSPCNYWLLSKALIYINTCVCIYKDVKYWNGYSSFSSRFIKITTRVWIYTCVNQGKLIKISDQEKVSFRSSLSFHTFYFICIFAFV